MVDVTKKTGIANEVFDPSMKEFQQSGAGGGSNWNVVGSIGISMGAKVDGELVAITGGEKDISWFTPDTGDITYMSVPEHGAFAFEGAELQASGSAYKGQTNNILSQELSFAIKAGLDSRFGQFLMNIAMTDAAGGHLGKLLVAYSNGGIHYKTVATDSVTGVVITTYWLNLCTTELPDPRGMVDGETEWALATIVNNAPIMAVTGNVASGLGLDMAGLNVSMAAVESNNTITLTPTVTDPDNFLAGGSLWVEIFNTSKSAATQTAFSQQITTPYVYTMPAEHVGDKHRINYWMRPDQNILIFAGTIELGAADITAPVVTSTTNTITTWTTTDTKTYGDVITEAGVTATDDVDGVITTFTITDGGVEKVATDSITLTVGIKQVLFTATDAAGNISTPHTVSIDIATVMSASAEGSKKK